MHRDTIVKATNKMQQVKYYEANIKTMI